MTRRYPAGIISGTSSAWPTPGLSGATPTASAQRSGIWTPPEVLNYKDRGRWYNVVTDGLTLFIDPGNSDCYPGSGSTITDLSGSGNNGSQVSMGHSSSTNGGVFTLAATGYLYFPAPNYAGSSCTVMGAARYTTVSEGRIFSSAANNWLMGHWSSTTENHYAEGWVTAVDAGASDTNWRFYAATRNHAGDSSSFYLNNTLNAGPSAAGSAGPNGFTLGSFQNLGERSHCAIGVMLVYNRVLTTDEMTHNYNEFKDRYGL